MSNDYLRFYRLSIVFKDFPSIKINGWSCMYPSASQFSEALLRVDKKPKTKRQISYNFKWSDKRMKKIVIK